MNIVSLAMNFLTPAVIGRIASALGINPTIAQMAVTAALPAILGGIAGKAAQPSGLGVLTGLLGQQSPSLLSGLGDMIGGSNQASMVSAGTGALNSLFGNSTTGALAGAIGKFAGMPESASSSLLGMLAPVALGTLAQQQKSSGLDAGGLASMLAGQKDNIAAAMPKGFGDLLKGTGLLDSAPSMTSTAAGAVRQAASTASATASSAANKVQSGVTDAGRTVADRIPVAPATSGLMAYLPWLAAAALALGIYSFWQSNRGPAVPVGSKIIYNNVDVSGKAASLYEGIKTNVASIKDANSAQASLPKLREAVTSLGEIRDLQEKMPADSRKGLATLFGTLVPGLEGLVGTALKAPGAEAVVKPVLDQVMERMKTLAKG